MVKAARGNEKEGKKKGTTGHRKNNNCPKNFTEGALDSEKKGERA